MLEKNVTQLDQDFITVWCRYILLDKNSTDVNALREIEKELEKLARLGQINAIQSYYLFNPPGDKIIDSYVQDLMLKDNLNFNELWAIGNYYRALEDFRNEDRKMLETYFGLVYFDETLDYQSEKYPKLCETKEEIMKYTSMIYRNKAVEEAKFQAKTYGNLLVKQRWVELNLAQSAWILDPRAYTLPETMAFITHLRNDLIDAYKVDKDNDLVKYALGKNLAIFADTVPTSKKEFDMGIELLKELSNRPIISKNKGGR